MESTDARCFRFACPGCGATLKAPSSSAGSRRHCPRCHANVAVPDPPPGTPPVVRDALAPRDYRDPKRIAEKERRRARREQSAWQAMGRRPPAGSVFKGTFSFPFYPGTLSATFWLYAVSLVATAVLAVAFSGGAVEGVYFRLLGRYAWFCSGRFADETTQANA